MRTVCYTISGDFKESLHLMKNNCKLKCFYNGKIKAFTKLKKNIQHGNKKTGCFKKYDVV